MGELRRPELPTPHALAPRRRKYCERFGRHAREAACCLRKAFLRSQTRGALRGGWGGGAIRAGGASAMAGSTKGELRQPDSRRPARARSAPADILRALRHAREAAGCLRKALLRSPTRALRGGSGNLAVRTRSIHAGGNSASASGGTPATRRAACVGRSCAARRGARSAARDEGAVPRQFGQAAGAFRVHDRFGDSWATNGELRQPEPAARARSTPAETVQALRLARPRGGVLLA